MTDDDIKAARALLAAATPGPWVHHKQFAEKDALMAFGGGFEPPTFRYASRCPIKAADAALIAACPEVIAGLLAALTEARADLRDMRNDLVTALEAARGEDQMRREAEAEVEQLSRPRSVVMDERVTTLEAEVAKLRAVVDAAIAMRDSYGVSTKLRLALEALETGHG